MHWLTVLVIAGLVATAFLPGTFLNVGMNGGKAPELKYYRSIRISHEMTMDAMTRSPIF
jgi:Ni,Fe-hydrogenase I cytochrome b subunit